MTRIVIIASVVVWIVGFGVGFYSGHIWTDRGHAKAALVEKTAALGTAQKDLADYHTALQQASQQFQTDAAALRSIAEDYANGRNDQARFYAAHNAKLETFLASRPDLDACDIGPVGLGLWNAANRGADASDPAGAGTSAGADRPEPHGAVPGSAVGLIWKIAGSPAQPRTGDGVVSRLPAPPAQPWQRGEDAAGAGSGTPATRPPSVGHSRAALMLEPGDIGW